MTADTSEQLLRIPIEAGTTATHIETHSGIARHYPQIFGNLVGGAHRRDCVLLMFHPSSGFLGHFLLHPFAAAGIPIVGLNTRYAGSDSTLILENAVVDVGAAVRFLKHNLGFERVVLVGFSGGGSLAALYQHQAEAPDITSTPCGDPPDLTIAGLLPADAIVLIAAHVGRATTLQRWIDPSVIAEDDPYSVDSDLDLFAEHRSLPFDRGWLREYFEAQRRRMDRITRWVEGEFRSIQANPHVTDRAFVVHRTVADPRFLDLTLDPSDRQPGSLYGDPRVANSAVGGLGRHTSLRSWLSSWSPEHSRGNALEHLPHVSVPVGIIQLNGDQAVMPSDATAMRDACCSPGSELMCIDKLNHYFLDQPWGAEEVVRVAQEWLRRCGIIAR